MTTDDPALIAFRAEAEVFIGALDELAPSAWERATRCAPWRVRDVVGHVITVLARVPDMIAAPEPRQADTTATGYYRPDHRFSDTANTSRVETARGRAAGLDGAAIVQDLAETATTVVTICRQQGAGRIVQTRHGDAMLLTDFLSTRVVELAVHGLDVADALEQQPWLTAPAAHHLQQLLFGADWRPAVSTLGWDPVTLLRKTSGRAPVTPDEAADLARLGLRALALG
ncbi:maleylpyruvate isomerase N-terminal domain-containing protein [Plantactinospora sp. S1510]|uniref:Maleylpyruvate isomerase N-terminal domain-containing protein n=1 Tax=Plantactinospora alkalitolerans TaxID=2789879 RepID=A0ABS0GYA5_9ACTN|nr:maleylpyruvate isomerase N-terminal domain-containing protein [Plantactinospora alkalitolerans]MBF9131185.1 maleylpyruvate isomerase N-terminal domain-containing protein [Plantactinospora alkalitolerans]